MRRTLDQSHLVEQLAPYRVGGAEFFVLLPGADPEKTTEIAERLTDAALLGAKRAGRNRVVSSTPVAQ